MRTPTRLLALIAVAAVSLVPATAASARGADDVRRAGTCTASSSSKIKLSAENGKIEVEFEVDQNRNGRRWNVKIMRGSRVLWSGVRTTRAPSGSFEVRKVVANRPGTDRLTGWAKRVNGAETCRATASF